MTEQNKIEKEIPAGGGFPTFCRADKYRDRTGKRYDPCDDD